MSRNSIRGGGDSLARGARSASFAAGGAKKGDKVQINSGIMMSDEDRKALDKAAPAPVAISKPVMKRTLRPLYDRILVRKATVDEVSKGGIFIPEEATERPREGTVLRVGKGKRDVNGVLWELDVKEGDRVLYGQYAGTEIKIDGETLLMMREDEILCTVIA
jgi:chaperonin GroES